ncbi:hypothetical protein A2U01_0066764, partial [Trifolium medium]|nr:hypothetical protein [Trifolium medium]
MLLNLYSNNFSYLVIFKSRLKKEVEVWKKEAEVRKQKVADVQRLRAEVRKQKVADLQKPRAE